MKKTKNFSIPKTTCRFLRHIVLFLLSAIGYQLSATAQSRYDTLYTTPRAGVRPGIVRTMDDGSGGLMVDTVIPSYSTGTVTSVNGTGAKGISVTGGPIATSGSLTVSITNGSLGDSLMATTYLKAANNLSDVVSASTARTNLGLGSLAALSSVDLSGAEATGTLAAARFPALTGDVTNSAGSLSTTVGAIQGKSVTLATGYLKYTGSAWSFDNSTFLTGNQTITLSGDVSGSGATAITTAIGANKVTTTTINNSAVTLAKIANIADQTILGNNSGGSAAPLALTQGQADVVIFPDSTGNTSKYFQVKAGGGYGWATVSGGSGTVTSVDVGIPGMTSSGAITTSGTINMTGNLSVTNGGTGDATLLNHAVLLGNGTFAVTNATAVTADSAKYLQSQGANNNPVWVAPVVSITSAIVNLTSPASWIVKDSLNSANTLIHPTSVPTTANFYYVVKTADVPTNTNIANYLALFAFGGKNRNAAGAVTVNWRGCRNVNPATQFASAAQSISTTASQFWSAYVWYDSVQINIGDTLSLKLWASTADTTDIRYCDIYIMPRLITGGSNYEYFYGANNNSTNAVWDDGSVFKGAVSGVGYSSLNSIPCAMFLDTAVSGAILQMPLTNANAQVLFTIAQGQYLVFGSGAGSLPNDINGAGTSNAAATLVQLPASNGTSRRIKYMRKLTFGVK